MMTGYRHGQKNKIKSKAHAYENKKYVFRMLNEPQTRKHPGALDFFYMMYSSKLQIKIKN